VTAISILACWCLRAGHLTERVLHGLCWIHRFSCPAPFCPLPYGRGSDGTVLTAAELGSHFTGPPVADDRKMYDGKTAITSFANAKIPGRVLPSVAARGDDILHFVLGKTQDDQGADPSRYSSKSPTNYAVSAGRRVWESTCTPRNRKRNSNDSRAVVDRPFAEGLEMNSGAK
jgi:hypothetical protein